MEILCLGLSHQTAPVELRERFAIPDGELAARALALSKCPDILEAVIVSTCNRVELYVVAEDASRGMLALHQFVAGESAQADLGASAFYRLSTLQSLRHLFRVVSGLESMVLGETEILGQVKKAYQAAQLGGGHRTPSQQIFPARF